MKSQTIDTDLCDDDKERCSVNSLPHSAVASNDVDRTSSGEEPQTSTISSLLKKYILNQEKLNSRMRTVETELLTIYQLNRQSLSQIKSSTSQMNCSRRRLRNKSETTISSIQAKTDITRQDTLELKEQIDKLSSLIRSRRKTNYEEPESITYQYQNPLQSKTEETSEESMPAFSKVLSPNTSDNDDVTSIKEEVSFHTDMEEEEEENLTDSYSRKEETATFTAPKDLQSFDSDSDQIELKDRHPSLVAILNKKKQAIKDWSRPKKPKTLTPECIKKLRDKYFSKTSYIRQYEYEDRLTKCRVCHKILDKYVIDDHMKKHKKPKSYPCPVCKQTFPLSRQLNKHMRAHPEFRPYKCTVCSKTYATPYVLKTHMMYHSGQKSHMCSICGNTFWHITHLKVHTMIHTGEAPFKCTECPRRFKTQSIMRSHRSQIHSNDRPILCSECGKTFKLAQGLRQHMANVHKDKDKHKVNSNSNTHTNVNNAQQTTVHQSKLLHDSMHSDSTLPYQYKMDHLQLQMEPPKMDANSTVHQSFHFKMNCNNTTTNFQQIMEPPKMEEALHQNYLEHPYLRFPDMSASNNTNRLSNYFMPPEPTPFPFHHNPQMNNRDASSTDVFDKWE